MSDETRKTPRRRRATEPLSSSAAAPAQPDAVDGQSEDDAHLSEAARGVIRQSADPRLDAHLARMLSEPAAPVGSESAPASGPDIDAAAEQANELERVREELQTARAAADTARQQVQTLTWVLIVAVAAIVVLLGVAVLK